MLIAHFAVKPLASAMGKVDKRTTAEVFAALPSAVKNQCIQDAKSVFKKYAKDMKSMERVNQKKPAEKQKVVKVPFLKKPVAIWNNQNYSIGDRAISFPVWKDGKSAKNLHSWSFYRLAQFIEYKASLAGISVLYVNPRYTSQTCPVCGTRNHASDRKYKCPMDLKPIGTSSVR